MEDESNSPPPQRKQYQNFRSANSINWRVKDDVPRGDSPQQQASPQPSGRGNRRGGGDFNGTGGGYGQGYGGRRERTDGEYQPRERGEPREIPDKPESSRLYVGNLLYTAQQADISDFFTTNGFNVASVSMSIDPQTGRNPSYCFVDLESVEEAAKAMEMLNGAEVMGRSVRINPGVARREGGGQGAGRRGFGSGAGGGDGRWGRDGGNAEGGYNPRGSADRFGGNSGRNVDSSTQSYSSARAPAPDSSKRLYVGRLPPIEPQSAVEAEMQTLFSRAEPPIEIATVSNLIAPHPSKASEPGDHHYLFIDLKTEADTDRAIEIFNDIDSPWNEGERLKVNRAKENRERKTGPRDSASRGFGQGHWRRGE